MLRNYFVPGFALLLAALIVPLRNSPSPLLQNQSGNRPQQTQNRRPLPGSNSQTGKRAQIEKDKPLWEPGDVCNSALDEMQYKLGEFGLSDGGDSNGAKSRAPAEAMIALVPDPIHTHLALAFDRTMDTIQQALQDEPSPELPGWVYTSQWLPWDRVPYQASENPIDRTDARTFDTERECAPGVLIFRQNRFQKGPVSEKFLAVFLVGESPTSGIINQEQFIHALKQWRIIQGSSSTLRILGPTFSSSLPSLDGLLQSEKCGSEGTTSENCFSVAQVISGTVETSPSIVYEHFRGLKDAHFLSLMESSETTQKMLLRYLHSQEDVLAEQVAFVSEDETPFGNLGESAHAGPPDSRESESGKKTESHSISFHFPREISQLRNAYEQNSTLTGSTPNPNPNAGSQSLKLSLEDRHEEEDSVPSFADEQSAISQETVLSSIARTMKDRSVRVAVISGSDVLDVVFVARFFRRNLPDVRIILSNADLFFLRSPDTHEFSGMLAVTTYPLIPDDAIWSGRFLKGSPDGPYGAVLPDRIFTSFDTQGIYNALRLVEFSNIKSRCAQDNTSGRSQSGITCIVDVNSAPLSLWLAEYKDPFHGGDRPPLWLNAIGRGRFWPIALLSDSSASSLPKISTSPAAEDDPDTIPPSMFGPSITWEGVVFVLFFFFLAGIVLCLFANIHRWPQYHFGVPQTNSERRAWIVFGIVLCYSWMTRLLILDLPAKEFFQNRTNWFLLVFEGVLLAFAIWLICNPLRTVWRAICASLLVLATIVAQIQFHKIMPDDFRRYFFYLYRSEHIFGGVSPVVPFLCLFMAFICLTSRHIKSLFVFSPALRPRVPSAMVNAVGLIQLPNSIAVRNIFEACSSPWRLLYARARLGAAKSPGWLTIAFAATAFTGIVLLLLLSLFALLPNGLETLETRGYRDCLAVFSFLIFFMLLHEIFWGAFHMDQPEERSAGASRADYTPRMFQPGLRFSWRHLWLRLDLSLESRYKPLTRAFESMKRVQRNLRLTFFPIEVAHRAETVQQRYSEMLSVQGDEVIALFQAYQRSLRNCAAAVILRILNDPFYQSEGLATSLDQPTEKVDKVLEAEAQANPLRASAQEFVALVYVHAIQQVLVDIRGTRVFLRIRLSLLTPGA